MMSAAVGRAERRNDSVLPAQSWNSSQTRTGFSLVWMASAIWPTVERGIARTEAMTPQKLMKSRLDTPLLSSSWYNQPGSSFMC
jgi:hypothetical protein